MNPRDPLYGLTDGCRVAPETFFGHRARWVVDASHVQTEVDHRGLNVFPIREVFTNKGSAFLGFGTPNVYLTVPDNADSWQMLAAFMFWRSKSRVIDTGGFVQAGVLFEMINLPDIAIERLRAAMQTFEGERCISCANQNSRVLTMAGFRSGQKPLEHYVRPSRLARAIWRNGLQWEGKEVDLRVIRTGPSVIEHFTNVWGREFTAPGRTIKRMFSGSHRTLHTPTITARDLDEASSGWIDGQKKIAIGISSPSWIGSRLNNIFGEHPTFVAWPDQPMTSPTLEKPLKAYPGKLNFMTKVKRYILFSKPVVWVLNKNLVKRINHQGEVPVTALLRMFRQRSDGQPFKYNLVAIEQDGKPEIRITRLENLGSRDNRIVNWILSKHVLVAGYHPHVKYACEVWVEYINNTPVLMINRNSGTYMPDRSRMEAFAVYLKSILETIVIIDNSK